jgi:PAS domain S-box-containing protein
MSDVLRTLLIDDNPDDRALVIRELRREFPNLRPHEVGDEATLARFLESPPFDLVITDWQLHWTDGLAAVRAIKARWPDCPVIMFTGTGSEEIAVEAMKAGLDDYVLKSPRHYPRLAGAAKLALKMADQRQQLKRVEARYGTLFNSVPVGLYRATPKGQIIDANPALVDMLHYPSQAALLAMNLADLYVNAKDYDNWVRLMQSEGLVHKSEAPFRTFEGAICWVENSARAVCELAHAEPVYEGTLEDFNVRKNADEERERLILELQNALATVKALSGLLPICASCKKIRDDRGYWNQIEEFIESHSDAEFTHSFCPDCMRRLYPEIFEEGATPEP